MKAQEPTKIKITAGNISFSATLQDNETATAFKAMLPLTLNMSELNGNEKYGSLPNSLPTNASNPGTIQNGDLMLYGSNTLVVFYKTFSTAYSYTKIGKIDIPTGLENALGTGSVTVKFEIDGITGLKDEKQQKNESVIIDNGYLTFTDDYDTITLIDINGKSIASSNSSNLNIQNVPKGIYIVSVLHKQKISSIKVRI